MITFRRSPAYIGTVLVVLSLAACGPAGSGNIVAEVRDVADFEWIDVREGIHIDLRVEQGEAHAVIVNYDDNIVDKIITRVSDGRLIVAIDGSVRLSGPDRSVSIVVPLIRGMAASGGASISASGATDGFWIDAKGGASVRTVDLKAFNVTVYASGGSSVDMFVSGSATGSASGGSSVNVVGSPGVVDIDSSGGASVSSR